MKNKILAIFMIPLGFAFAQDFDDWGDFSDDSSDSSFASSSPSIEFSGEVELQARMYLDEPEYAGKTKDDYDSFSDSPVYATPSAKIGMNYSATNVDAELKLKFDKDIIEDYPQDVIDELTIRGYFGKLKLEAGKMKVIWGKGDKLHVLDNFNADDYTDFIIPDYIDRRLSVPMLRSIYSFEKNDLRLEGIWTPYMEADRFATSGIWTPDTYTNLKTSVENVLANQLGSSIANSDASTLMSIAQFDEDSLYPDTKKLKYSQAGVRLTGTFGSLDWGASYYYGHYKQVSANLENYIANSGSALPELDYDWKQTFGLECATVLGRFNLRSELAYNLTDDVAGDNPWVHNNSIAWLAGFDFDIPISNININVQETGTYILQSEKIDDAKGFKEYGDMKSALRTYDVDYDNAGYTNNKLVLDITDSWMNDKITPEVLVLWGIERGDLVVQPKISYKPNGNLTLKLSGMIIKCKDEDSEFYEWRDNSFVNIGINCKF